MWSERDGFRGRNVHFLADESDARILDRNSPLVPAGGVQILNSGPEHTHATAYLFIHGLRYLFLGRRQIMAVLAQLDTLQNIAEGIYGLRFGAAK
jgi:hypothetical protein